MGKFIDISGKTFGEVTVLEDSGIRATNGDVFWRCVCSCGKEWNVRGSQLRKGMKSCGCLTRPRPKGTESPCFKHGHRQNKSFSPLYRAWAGMKNRCRSNNKNYGGRGITYAEEWESFEKFKEDMSNGHAEGLTLDRIDPNNMYCKENCRWIEPEKQARNRTRRRDNKSGVTGVSYIERNRGYATKCKDLDGKELTKFFSIAVYGDKAFEMACQWRESTLAYLNTKGAGYSEFHGEAKSENIEL